MKKRIILLIIVLINTSGLFAQDWLTDLDAAKEIAATDNKAIVLVFQGSDWCAPCIKLDKEIWSTDEFKTYADEHYVMLQADFPRRKKNRLPEAQAEANAKLADQYNKSGIFPFVVVLDKEGKVLGETGYEKLSPEAYISQLNSFIK